MLRVTTVVLMTTCFLFSLGCAGFSDFRRARRDRLPSHSSSNNGLWKQGYGFNNPNNERRRPGLEPVSFDGSPDRDDDGGFIGNFLGDLTVYGLKTSFEAVANLFTRSPSE